MIYVIVFTTCYLSDINDVKGENMAFYIQDPAGLSGQLLHDTILTEATKSCEGGGSFAFATKGGIDLFFDSPEFKQLLSIGEYNLIVGMDAITNTKAIDALIYYQEKYPNLRVKGFYHKENGVLFHPKFTWFRNSENLDEGSLIVGSGNLTPRGLRNNWEAYFATPLLKNQFKQTHDTWNNWLSSHAQFLLDLNDPKITEQAVKNDKMFQKLFSEKVKEKNNQDGNESPKPVIISENHHPQNNRYLVVEVPVGRIRNTPSAYTQANLGQQAFLDFFDIDIETEDNVYYFQHVTNQGDIEELESRSPIIKVNSSNYNFKLNATYDKGRPEPATPPICIFTEIGVRTYRYRFMLPSDISYDVLKRYLLSQPSISKGFHKYIGNQSDLYTVIPDATYLSALLAEEM